MKLSDLFEERLDELTRRGFLKGAAGAALGLIAVHGSMAKAEETPSNKFVWSQPFDTEEDAAVAGLKASVHKGGDKHELGNIVFKYTDGKYYYTEPQVNQTADGKDKAKDNALDNLRIRFPSKGKIAAFLHTHPDEEHVSGPANTSDQFSDGDIKFAKKFTSDHKNLLLNNAITLYILALKTGEVKRYVPGKTKTQSTSTSDFRMPGGGANKLTSFGEVVAKV